MRPLATLVLPFLAAAVAAQSSLELTVEGGSFPGTIEWSLRGGRPVQQGGLILLSLNAGPTPLALLDPRDWRGLDVGIDLLDLTQSGGFGLDGVFRPAPLPVPNLPSLLDAPLFFQGVSVPGFPLIVDQISEQRVVRFAPAGAWRDRQVTFQAPASFFPVIDGGGGRPMVAGGGQGSIFAQIAVKQTDIYDQALDTFVPGPDMTVERSLHTATELADGRWLIVGGVDFRNDPQTACEIWDPVAQTFTAVASMATPRMGHSATRLPDGRVLVAGGLTDLNAPVTPIDPIYSITASTEIYDPANDTWSAGPALRAPRAAHAVVQRADGRIVLAGGVSWFRLIIQLPRVEATVDVYDPATNRITAGPNLRTARAQPSVVEITPGRWLIAGGVSSITLTQYGTPTATAEIYDEAAASFTLTGSMAQQRTLHTAQPLGGGRFLHAGGGDGALFALTPLDSCEIYDVATGTFRSAPTLTSARAGHSAYRMPTGVIHVLGGSSAGGSVERSTEFFYR